MSEEINSGESSDFFELIFLINILKKSSDKSSAHSSDKNSEKYSKMIYIKPTIKRRNHIIYVIIVIISFGPIIIN